MAKITKNKASTGVDISQQHSSNDFMNYFTSKIDTIRDQIVTMHPSAILSHQIVYYRSPEEQFHSFSTIGEEELYKLVKSSKPTTCMLDPIPSKLLKEVLPDVIDPLLAIINSSLSLGYVPKNSLLVLLDLSAAFDTIDHNILLNRLENFVGISGSALAWFKSYLSDRHQFVAVNEEVSYRSQVQYGVPQGSVLGPLLFTLYMLPLGNIIRKHGVSFHCYADDTQLYISSRPGETHQIEKLMECIVDIKNWMTSNFLLLNSEKTEVLIIGPKTPTSNNLEHCLTLDGCSVNSSSSVRNLGVLFNSNLSFDSHVSSICKTAFFHLKNISKLRPMLSMSNAEILIHAFMTSRLDYCNALLGGCSARLINKLQMVQNAVARVLTRTRKYEHISPVLSTLHWLPTKHRF